MLIDASIHRLGHCCSLRVSVDCAFDVLRCLISAGASIEGCKCDDENIQAGILATGDFELLREWFSILSRNGFSVTDHVDLVQTLRCIKPHLVQDLVSLGLAPNGNPRSANPWDSPLPVCLGMLRKCLSESPRGSRDWECAIDNLVTLVNLGADLYQIAPVNTAKFRRRIARAFPNTPIATPTVLAIALGLEKDWTTVLRRSGLDPDEVYAKDERRRREFLRLQGANSSAVQIEEDSYHEQSVRQRQRTHGASDE